MNKRIFFIYKKIVPDECSRISFQFTPSNILQGTAHTTSIPLEVPRFSACRPHKLLHIMNHLPSIENLDFKIIFSKIHFAQLSPQADALKTLPV